MNEGGAFLHSLAIGNSTKDDNAVPMDKVYPALLESFGIIFLGYLAGK